MKTLDTGWMDRFGETTLMRGMAYHDDGCVTEVRCEDDGWHACVEGGERYSVRIAADDEGVCHVEDRRSYCSCPRYADGYLCKHMVAACLAIEDAEFMDVRENGASESDEFERVFTATGTPDKLAFLKAVLGEDARLRNRFVSRFGDPDIDRSQTLLRDEFTRIVNRHAYHGFVEWRDTGACEAELCSAIHDACMPLVEGGVYADAFALSTCALGLVRNVQADGSDGFYSILEEECFSVWRAILRDGAKREGAEAEAKSTVFDGICAFLEAEPDPGEVDDWTIEDQQANARSFLVERFADDPDMAQRVLQLALQELECYDTSTRTAPALYGYSRAKWAEVCLRAMKANGVTAHERFEFATPYLDSMHVRKVFVDEALADGDALRAIELLEGSRTGRASQEDAAPYSGETRERREVTEQLADLYEQVGDVDNALREIRSLVCSYSMGDEAAIWAARAKGMLGAAEWKKTLNDLLANANGERERMAIMEMEGLDKQLMRCVEESADIFTYVRFEPALKDAYPQHFVEAYCNETRKDLSAAHSRNGYRSALVNLARVKNLKGGKKAFAEEAAHIRSLYPRRPALLDELAKIGG